MNYTLSNLGYLKSKKTLLKKLSNSILKATNISNLFYFLCKFFAILTDSKLVQGVLTIDDDNYLINEFDSKNSNFEKTHSRKNYINSKTLKKVDSDINEILNIIHKKFINLKNPVSYKELYINNICTSYNEKFKDYHFIPVYIENSMYGFLIIQSDINHYLTNDIIRYITELILLQASNTLTNIYKKDSSTYINDNICDTEQLISNILGKPSSIICITTIDGYITFCSRNSEEILGYPSNFLVGKRLFPLIHKDYKEEFIQKYKKTLIDNINNYAEILFKCYDGTFTKVKMSPKCILDVHKNIVGIMFTISTVNNSLKNTQPINFQNNKLLDLNPFGIFMTKNGIITHSNKMGLNLLNINDVEQCLNKSIYDFFDLAEDYHRNYNEKQVFLFDNTYADCLGKKVIRKRDGKPYYLETLSFTTNGIPTGYILILIKNIENVYNSQYTEELYKKIEEKTTLLNKTIEYDKLRSEFFANISHELRTPINVIYSALQLLNINLSSVLPDYEDSDIFNKRILIIQQNCFRLIKLINNLIDSTRIDAGFYQLTFSKCNIISIIEDITLSVCDYVENKGIKLIFDTDIEEKYTYCDIEKIERIMLNLISNAVKFTDKGGSIFVNLHNKGTYLLISIEDTGVGIPKEKCNTIFQRFVQVNSTRKREGEGSGIGLSLVRSLVEMHSGNIWVESKLNKGTTFTIQLPYCVDPNTFINKNTNNTININYSNHHVGNLNNTNSDAIKIEFSDI
ncbi:sensor histidine kinase [Hathewaya limosa]|uniref:histidine kinase n=1 Tax=Hathewaya limosa TaxID=1536 RepID=A0ABU0JUL4_HATLI|nr:PAS domain-containing sensor histidine kinase [Hathewaya limosa]MDQ0480796.1 PAS domain S-box-containing protein [Hathewaya limosa]